MENQHKLIQGYRELSQEEIDTMNVIKVKAEEIGKLIEWLENDVDSGVDPRWIAIGRTNLQQGFMALTRAVAQPRFF